MMNASPAPDWRRRPSGLFLLGPPFVQPLLYGRVIEARPVNYKQHNLTAFVIETGSVVHDKTRPEMPTPFLLSAS